MYEEIKIIDKDGNVLYKHEIKNIETGETEISQSNLIDVIDKNNKLIIKIK